MHEEVAPSCCLAAVGAELLCEKAFEIGLWMKSLKDVSVEVGHGHKGMGVKCGCDH